MLAVDDFGSFFFQEMLGNTIFAKYSQCPLSQDFIICFPNGIKFALGGLEELCKSTLRECD